MRLIGLLPTALVASLIFPAGTQAAERARADVECTPSDQELVYDCMIMLTGKNSGAPMDGVEFTVRADMPSMPMVHNVKPVKAMPTGKQGMYHVRIKLEMHGEWVLRMDISRPARDTIIHKMRFGAS
ncbi:MAG: FixH family protein [Alphaproteobacteria bacterium]